MPRPANRWNGAVCDWMDKIREAWKQTANRADAAGMVHRPLQDHAGQGKRHRQRP